MCADTPEGTEEAKVGPCSWVLPILLEQVAFWFFPRTRLEKQQGQPGQGPKVLNKR